MRVGRSSDTPRAAGAVPSRRSACARPNWAALYASAWGGEGDQRRLVCKRTHTA
jgi:hypothetical protein